MPSHLSDRHRPASSRPHAAPERSARLLHHQILLRRAGAQPALHSWVPWLCPILQKYRNGREEDGKSGFVRRWRKKVTKSSLAVLLLAPSRQLLPKLFMIPGHFPRHRFPAAWGHLPSSGRDAAPLLAAFEGAHRYRPLSMPRHLGQNIAGFSAVPGLWAPLRRHGPCWERAHTAAGWRGH